MKKDFSAKDWEKYVPEPVCEDFPEYNELYKKAWELARRHIKKINGMPQSPYMDEAFCETRIWIWDSCFMSLFCKYAQHVFPGIETLDNFYEVLYQGKKLPEIIPSKNEPKWTGAVAGKPYRIQINIADNPPLFAWAEYENTLINGDFEYLKKLLYEKKVLQKHYEWIEGLRATTLLDGVACPTCLIAEKKGYKWEGGRSGMDNTPRGRTTPHAVETHPYNPNLLWIDAICQQAFSAHLIAKLFAILKDRELEAEWNEKYEIKKKIINSLYWDETDKFYYDIDCNSGEYCKVMTIASYWALTSGVASKERARILVKHLLNPKTFGGFVPLVSLSRNDNDYKQNGSYWRGSVWLPTAYAALKGAINYGFYNEAHIVASKLLNHMCKTYEEFTPHTIWECYSPEEYKPGVYDDGKYFVRPDFCGWSALGPISIYIEFILGFHTVNAFTNTVEWAKPDNLTGKMGVKNLRFGDVITDILAVGNKCTVTTNKSYILKINEKAFKITEGLNEFSI